MSAAGFTVVVLLVAGVVIGPSGLSLITEPETLIVNVTYEQVDEELEEAAAEAEEGGAEAGAESTEDEAESGDSEE